MPSPMAFNRSSSPSSSMFAKKKKSSASLTSAASYLAAVKQADAEHLARAPKSSSSSTTTSSAHPSPASTPALSFSSSLTVSSGGTALEELDERASSTDDGYGYTAKTSNGNGETYGSGSGEAGEDDGLSFPPVPPTSEQVFHTVHTEFGHCADERFRYTSAHPAGAPVRDHGAEVVDPPYYILLTTYFSYLILICMGHVRDFFGKRAKAAEYKHLMPADGYAPLNSDFDSFYTRRLKNRIEDCFAQPVTGVAGRTITLLDRHSSDNNKTQQLVGTQTRTLNISSYNYLGFAQARGGCADAVHDSLNRYGIGAGGARLEGGTLDLHVQAEQLVARFVGQEDALISGMGYATNSTVIPALLGKGALVISDELNHASIRVGARQSGASVRMYPHNDMRRLEALLREVISQGQPRTHRPWKKILVIVEGLFSMEGTMVNLPALVALKKKYKFYLFVDEAHSIGAIGPHGRGVCDYFGIDPRNVDVLMGTFTKSFGAAGGYIAGSRQTIDRLRLRGYSGVYAESMTPPVLTQVVASMASIMGVVAPSPSSPASAGSSTTTLTLTSGLRTDHPGPAPMSVIPSWIKLPKHLADGSEGRTRLRRLAFNSRYLHRGLRKLGFITYGTPDSPIVPLLLFNPGKMGVFWRMMRQRRTPIVVVVVAYPATPLVTSRVRFCVSASHTKSDIDTVLEACDQIGDVLDLKHGPGPRWTLEKIMASAVELVHMQDDEA